VRDDADWWRLCAVIPGLAAMPGLDLAARRAQASAIDDALTTWTRDRPAQAAAAILMQVGIPAAALARSRDLVEDAHLRARGFWDADGAGVLPGLPWRASFGRVSGDAPGPGANTEMILAEVLELSSAEIAALRTEGALG
jgi:crotonobetainyl-CoA:carnitine CoA-transferase CaiB-like acyl-CoA transferase